MNNKRKNEQNILKLFENFSDESLLQATNIFLIKSLERKKAEKIVKCILEKYNIKANFRSYSGVENYKNKLIKCIKLRKLKIPRNWYKVNLTEEYIRNIFWEAYYEEIFDVENNTKEEDKLQFEILKDEIYEKYAVIYEIEINKLNSKNKTFKLRNIKSTV